MRTTIQTQFVVDVCYDFPESDEMIGFDICFRFRVPAYDNQWRAETLLKATCWETAMGERFGHHGTRFKYIRRGKGFQIRQGRKPWRRFHLAQTGSGGNMHWDSINTGTHNAPHVINALRQLKWFDVDEWDDDFRERVWKNRRSIDKAALRKFGGRFVRAWLKQIADDAGCQVKDLLNTFPV